VRSNPTGERKFGKVGASVYDFLSDKECLERAGAIDAPLNDRRANRAIAACHLYNTKQYISAVGEAPNYVNPSAQSEKMQCRKLFDRNPLFTMACDKLAARAYALASDPRLKLSELLWVGDNADDIPFDRLDTPYVIKPNNSSGAKIVVKHPDQVDAEKFRARCRAWLGEVYGQEKGEWGYVNARRKILVERFIEAPHGASYPEDYRLYAYSGRVELLEHEWLISDWESYATYFDREWNRLHFNCWEGWWVASQRLPALEKVDRPHPLAAMVAIGENLAREFDYVRVDYYVRGDDIYFGELTVYDQSGFAFPFPEDAEFGDYPPRDVDYRLGALWKFRNPPLGEKLAMAAAAVPGTDAARDAMALARQLEFDREAEARLDLALAIEPDLPAAQLAKSVFAGNRGASDVAIAAARRALALDGEEARHHDQLANLLCEAGRVREAVAALDSALALLPGEALLHHRLALVERQRKRPDAAIDAMRRAVELAPDDRDMHELLVKFLDEAGRADELAAAIGHAIDRFPGDAEMAWRLARVREAAGETDDALRLAELAWSIRPGAGHLARYLADLLVGRSRTLADAGRMEEAIEAGRKAVDVAIDSGRPAESLADMLFAAGRHDAARETVLKGISAFPGWTGLYSRLSAIEEARGQTEQALEAIDNAIERDAENGYHHAQKLSLLMKLGRGDRLDEAIAFAQAHAEGNSGLEYRIADIRNAAGRKAEARLHADRADVLEPLRPHVVALRASLMIDSGETDAAAEALSAMIAHSDDHAGVRHQMSRVAEAREEPEVAAAHAMRAAELSPDNAYFPELVAELRLRTGDFEGARQQVLAAIPRFPENARIKYLLARALAGLGEREAALEQARLAAETDPRIEYIRQYFDGLREASG